MIRFRTVPPSEQRFEFKALIMDIGQSPRWQAGAQVPSPQPHRHSLHVLPWMLICRQIPFLSSPTKRVKADHRHCSSSEFLSMHPKSWGPVSVSNNSLAPSWVVAAKPPFGLLFPWPNPVVAVPQAPADPFQNGPKVRIHK